MLSRILPDCWRFCALALLMATALIACEGGVGPPVTSAVEQTTTENRTTPTPETTETAPRAEATSAATPTSSPTPAPQAADSKYDTDGDGLIEVSNLEQMDAIRHDLDGDGKPDWDSGNSAAYGAAFPNEAEDMGCPASGCTGYELVADLDFDTNGNGRADAGDAYWNGGAGWEPIGTPEVVEYIYEDPDPRVPGIDPETGIPLPPPPAPAPSWDIVQEERPFAATFDGNGHTVSNLYINRPEQDELGLFGITDYGSSVEEIGLVSVDVTGHFDIGGIVGWNNGTVAASYATGNVTGDIDVGGLIGHNSGTVTACYATASVTSGKRAGGLVGGNDGLVTDSYATGSVTGQSSKVGGLVGLNNRAVITGSYSTGSVTGIETVGGLVGLHMNKSVITASYATGRVTGNEMVGGLIGENNEGLIIASYWDSNTSGQATGVGQGSSAGVEGKTTAELQAPTGHTGIYATWGDTEAGDVWDFGTSNDYPILKGISATSSVSVPPTASQPTPTATPTPMPVRSG